MKELVRKKNRQRRKREGKKGRFCRSEGEGESERVGEVQEFEEEVKEE